jgi:ABC-type polysaccharide/polyol phosphate transport system ATPase subunit
MNVIELDRVGIRYRRYRRQVTTLKEKVVGFFKGNHYETFWALRDVALNVRKGESLGVIGPNGSGKSTMLRVIAGVLRPSEGEARINGRVAPLLDLSGGFRLDLTGRENIFLNGAILGMSPREIAKRVDRIIEFADVGDFIDAPLTTYSSGMRARLGFAVATDVDPDILLLDEILSVGDGHFRTKAITRIESLFRDRTVVVVSHGMGDIVRLCQRAIYLRAGHVVVSGKPDEVIARYQADIDAASAAPAAKVS